MAETVGVLNVEIRGRADTLDRDLRVAERKSLDSAARIEKGIGQALSVGKLAAGIRAITSATELAFAGFDFITAKIEGNLGRAYEAANTFATRLKGVPLVGDAFKLGQFIGGGVDDDAEAARINEQTQRAEQDRANRLKAAEQSQQKIRDLTRETALLEAKGDPEKQRRLQAQNRFDDATTGISGFTPEAQAAIRRLAAQRQQLELQSQSTPRFSSTTLSAAGVALNVGGRSVQPPDKGGQNKTNQLLQEIRNLTRAQRFAVTV